MVRISQLQKTHIFKEASKNISRKFVDGNIKANSEEEKFVKALLFQVHYLLSARHTHPITKMWKGARNKNQEQKYLFSTTMIMDPNYVKWYLRI